MKTQGRLVVGRLARRRVLIAWIWPMLVAPGVAWLGEATGHLTLARGAANAFGVGYLGLIITMVVFAASTTPYALNVLLRTSEGLVVDQGRLVLLFPWFKSVPLHAVGEALVGPEVVFEGVPDTVTFRLADGGALVVRTHWFETHANEIIARLKELQSNAAPMGDQHRPLG